MIKASGLKDSMVYHSLFGKPLIINEEGVRFLNMFREPKKESDISTICSGDPSDLVENFKQRRFLCEPDVDERSLLRNMQGKHLRSVAEKKTIDRMGLAISETCNFGCKHCLHFQKEGNNPGTKNTKALLMSWDVARRCVDSYLSVLRNQELRSGKIHFGNAEPLFNWKVIEKVLRYCESQKDISFQFTINTNLSILTREMAEILKRFKVTIATSLDGTEQGNDAIRQTRKGEPTYHSIIEKFDLLAEIDYPLDGFSITVTKDNFDLVDEEIVDLAASRQMVNLAFDYDLIGLVKIPIKERVAKLMRLRQYANRCGIDFFGTWDSPFRNLTCGELETGKQFFCAAIGGHSMEFNVDGSIKVCGHSRTKVGHIDRVEEVFGENGGLTKLVERRLPGNDSFCYGCEIEGPCGGQCHVTREVDEGKQAETFKDMCSFYREVTRALAYEHTRFPDSLTKERGCCSI
jgi:uncharacterized protein